jgi:hypothetical protein
MAAGAKIETLEGYRETLAEIRRLRTGGARSEDHELLGELEAAAAEFSERLRAAELRKGRPDTKAT